MCLHQSASLRALTGTGRAAQQDELDQILQSVFQKYEVNLNKISRYARRRNQISELEKRINRLNLNL